MTTVKTINSVHLTQIRPKSPCPWESGFRSQRFLLSLSSLLNRGHINTGTACRGYFQPFGQGIEKASLQQETSMENMCQEKKNKKKRNERQGKRASYFPYSNTQGPDIYPTLLLLLLSCFSRVQLCTTLWTVARQAPPSMEFSRQEYWSGLPCPPPGDLPNPGIKSWSPALQADSPPLSHQDKGSPYPTLP